MPVSYIPIVDVSYTYSITIPSNDITSVNIPLSEAKIFQQTIPSNCALYVSTEVIGHRNSSPSSALYRVYSSLYFKYSGTYNLVSGLLDKDLKYGSFSSSYLQMLPGVNSLSFTFTPNAIHAQTTYYTIKFNIKSAPYTP